MSESIVQRLRTGLIDPLKTRFVGREEVVDLIALAVVAGEHLFLFGPPGTAKSALIRQFAMAVRGPYFEYLLTRFSEPNELFGPVDLIKLREGVVTSVTTGMLPEAEFAFLDELFNANSAILNNLLTVLNERVFRRGAETRRLPLLSLFSASNHLPEDETLAALFDRFLLRCRVEQLPRESLPQLLAAGWALEADGAAPLELNVNTSELRELSRQVFQVDLSPVLREYAEAVTKLRDLGVNLSDRRAVKVLKLVAASAVLCERQAAHGSDLWVLRYVWDRAEQIAPLASLTRELLTQVGETPVSHALARLPEQVEGEQLARLLDEIEQALNQPRRTLLELARLRERVTDIADQVAWIADPQARKHLLERSGRLLGQLGN